MSLPRPYATPQTTVRPARIPDELALVRTLFEEYADGLEVDLCFQGFAEELAGLPGRYAPPGGGLWLAFADGAVAGCIGLRPLEADVCEIKRLYVRPAVRDRGLGRVLAECALSRASEAGYGRVYLDTLPSMTGALALYRSLGFVEIEPYYDNPVRGALFLERGLQ